MKLTKERLKQIIKEELARICEIDMSQLSQEEWEKIRQSEMGPGVAMEVDASEARYDFVVEEVKKMDIQRLEDLSKFIEDQIFEKGVAQDHGVAE